jgi:protein required for attachment to host cells
MGRLQAAGSAGCPRHDHVEVMWQKLCKSPDAEHRRPEAGQAFMKQMKKTAWALLADSAGARLIECERTPGGSCHVEERDSLRAVPRPHQRGRPTMTRDDGRTSSGEKQAVQDEMHRFARDLARWVSQRVKQHQIEGLTVFAPARFLGAIRQTRLEQLAGGVTEAHGELACMDTPALARQPLIRVMLLGKARPRLPCQSKQPALR